MRPIALAAAAAVVASLGFASVGFAPAHAQAAPDGAALEVVVDALTPVVPTPTSTLRIAGRVVNASPTQVGDVRVRLRVSSAPVASRDDLAAIAVAPLDPPAGSVPASTEGYALDWTSADVSPALASSQEAPFAITVPIARLPLGRAGAYVVSIEAVGRGSADAAASRQGITRTFLPWWPQGRAADAGVALTWLWPLADAPARTASGTLLDPALPASLAPDGRLGRLVRLGARQPVTWVADPELLQAARAIGDGYQVDRDGTTVVGDDAGNGPAWLDALGDAVTEATPLHLLPYADVDATAVRRAGLAPDVTQAITTAPRTAEAAAAIPQGEPLAWMPGGTIDRQTSNLLVTSGVRAAVLSGEALEPTTGTPSGVAAVGTIAGPLAGIVADPQLSALLAVPAPTNAIALALRQQFLAHTALIASEPDAVPGRVIAIAPPLRWDPAMRLVEPLLRATRTAPWLAPATLDDLLASPRTPRQRLPYPPDAKRAELGPGYLQAVAREQARLASFAAVLDDPAPVIGAFGQAILRAESSAWREQPAMGKALLASITSELKARIDAVHVLSSGSIVFSGDVGAVPVTIENDLDVPVTVGVQLIGQPAARLSSAPLEGIRIEAGKRVSIDLDARVVGGDPLPARVQLLTPGGERYGTPAEVTLSSTAYARAAAWVVGVAFAAIAVFVVVGITRRIRRARSAQAGSAGPGTPSGRLPG